MVQLHDKSQGTILFNYDKYKYLKWMLCVQVHLSNNIFRTRHKDKMVCLANQSFLQLQLAQFLQTEYSLCVS